MEIQGDLEGNISVGGGSLSIRAQRLIGVYCSCDDGSHYVRAEEGDDMAVEMYGGDFYWEVPKTTGPPENAAFWLSDGTLRVSNSVIVANEDVCSPGYGIALQGGKCILKDSHVIDNEHNYAVTSNGSGSIVCLGAVWSNKPLDPNVTNLTNNYQSFFYDSDVEF